MRSSNAESRQILLIDSVDLLKIVCRKITLVNNAIQDQELKNIQEKIRSISEEIEKYRKEKLKQKYAYSAE